MQKEGHTGLQRPFYSESTVAEHTFALILSLSRPIHKSHERTRRGDFSCEDTHGFELKEKTLGVVGTGNIGSQVIRIGKGFAMKILAYDKYPNRKFQDELGFEYADSTRLLKEADIITLHLPLNQETHHLDKERRRMMKKGAIVINTASGGPIDTTIQNISLFIEGKNQNIIPPLR